jgi:Terminase large subunit, T4likevirus-type, N-terminal
VIATTDLLQYLTADEIDELDLLLAVDVGDRTTPIDLHPKQRLAFESQANEILYGGAAGGGKSHLMRRAAITWCKWVAGLQVYLFRREFGDLFMNHMESSGGFRAMLADEISRGECRIVDKQIRWKNGSTIHLCHCQHEKDVHGYQGAEIHVLMIDELTQWSRKMYTFLRGRLRLGGLQVPHWLRGTFPRILSSANPGGIGHNWVKADFVDPAPETTVTQTPKSEGGMRRQFIRALLEDNPTLTENDPDYEHRLEGLGDPALVRAMRLGDWDIVAGGMFDDVWSRDAHVLKPFPIPFSWRVDRAFDWGSSKPFSVGWWAESDGTRVEVEKGKFRTFPRGSLIRINEWYGWTGVADTGCKMPSSEVAKGIKEREREMRMAGPRGESLPMRIHPGPADSSIYDVDDKESTSTADTMAQHGVHWNEADKSPGSRKNGWEKLREMLLEAKKPQPEAPGLWVFNTCAQFIRVVPVLPRDPKKPDDVQTTAEDHIGDETRYRVLALSRVARRSSFSPV